MTDNEWDDNEYPLAYLITIRTFGTWLHGDERGSVDRHGKNIYGTARIKLDPKFSSRMLDNTSAPDFLLDGRQRACVEAAIRRVCSFRDYGLRAINVRTNHVHSVVSAAAKPEVVINAFKANATRELRASDWSMLVRPFGRAVVVEDTYGSRIKLNGQSNSPIRPGRRPAGSLD